MSSTAQADVRQAKRLGASETEEPAFVPMRFDRAGAPAVIQAGGVPVALPAGFTGDDIDKGRLLVVVVQAPAADRRLRGRGNVSGFFVGTYYAAATASKLWLPLALLGVWLFWAPLLSYGEGELVAVISRALSHLKLW